LDDYEFLRSWLPSLVKG